MAEPCVLEGVGVPLSRDNPTVGRQKLTVARRGSSGLTAGLAWCDEQGAGSARIWISVFALCEVVFQEAREFWADLD